MRTYIATFYSHFGAVRYKKQCEDKGMAAKMRPVPRNLSSSCGTCVQYEGEQACPAENYPEELEQVVEVIGDGYKEIYRAD